MLQTCLWLNKINIPYYHVIGKEDLEKPHVFENNILYVKTPDDYCSLPKKVISAYEAIYEQFEFKYVFKTDDDQLLTNLSFFDILTSYLTNNELMNYHYGGNVCYIDEECNSKYWEFHEELPNNIKMYPTQYCNGRFYILSKSALVI
jgi:hypothetical protein